MADRAKKISEITSANAVSGDDLLIVVDDPSGTSATKSISVDNFFTGSAIANGSFANLDVSNTATIANAELQTVKITGSQLKIDNTTSVTSNNATTLFGSASHDGKLFWDANYLYLATSNTVIKRIALSDWNS